MSAMRGPAGACTRRIHRASSDKEVQLTRREVLPAVWTLVQVERGKRERPARAWPWFGTERVIDRRCRRCDASACRAVEECVAEACLWGRSKPEMSLKRICERVLRNPAESEVRLQSATEPRLLQGKLNLDKRKPYSSTRLS